MQTDFHSVSPVVTERTPQWDWLGTHLFGQAEGCGREHHVRRNSEWVEILQRNVLGKEALLLTWFNELTAMLERIQFSIIFPLYLLPSWTDFLPFCGSYFNWKIGLWRVLRNGSACMDLFFISIRRIQFRTMFFSSRFSYFLLLLLPSQTHTDPPTCPQSCSRSLLGSL